MVTYWLCVNPGEGNPELIKGKVYTAVRERRSGGRPFLVVVDDDGHQEEYYKDRFVKMAGPTEGTYDVISFKILEMRKRRIKLGYDW